MAKYIVKYKQWSFGYMVVEANSEAEAMKIRPTKGQIEVTDSNFARPIRAKKIQGNEYVACKHNQFNVVTKKNLANTKRKDKKRLGYMPLYEPIKETPKP